MRATAYVLALLWLGASAYAGEKKQDRQTVMFNEQEKAAIVAHFRLQQQEAALYQQYHDSGKKRHEKALPPGLQKKAAQASLPPGWEKKLQRGQRLGSDIYSAAEPLPPQLLTQLPAGPLGTITVHVEGKILRLLEARHEVVDILDL